MPLLTRPNQIAACLEQIRNQPLPPAPRVVLMVPPTYFEVRYAINPHMVDADGNLNQVIPEKAHAQWNHLKTCYESCGLRVELIPPQPDLPDMTFAANQSLTFLDATGHKAVLMSKMASTERAQEVSYFRRWYTEQGYRVYELEGEYPFEGTGDGLWQFPLPILWGGHGFRTHPSVYEDLEHRFGWNIVPLELIKPEFYHLDTCMAILSADCVAICQQAFTPKGIDLIHAGFSEVISVSYAEASHHFACNSHSPDGKHVLLQSGSGDFVQTLNHLGFTPVEVDVGEFQKSGGSVFCLKMMVY
jgi:N-dimethylarginine dimethylaminohydrolase